MTATTAQLSLATPETLSDGRHTRTKYVTTVVCWRWSLGLCHFHWWISTRELPRCSVFTLNNLIYHSPVSHPLLLISPGHQKVTTEITQSTYNIVFLLYILQPTYALLNFEYLIGNSSQSSSFSSSCHDEDPTYHHQSQFSPAHPSGGPHRAQQPWGA